MTDARLLESIETALEEVRRDPTPDELISGLGADLVIARGAVSEYPDAMDGIDLGVALRHVSVVRSRIRHEALVAALTRVIPAMLSKCVPLGDTTATEFVGRPILPGAAPFHARPTDEELAPTDADFDAAAELLNRAREAVGRFSGGAHHGDGAMLVEVARVAKEMAQDRAWSAFLWPKAAETADPEVPSNG